MHNTSTYPHAKTQEPTAQGKAERLREAQKRAVDSLTYYMVELERIKAPGAADYIKGVRNRIRRNFCNS